jgi:EAL domain-containing protein (putative c-di-GMP-specific phosphodiesterase class I)
VKTDRQSWPARSGCRIAIDDFGTGYSSFSYLKRLPVDQPQDDGSFIKGLPRDKADQSMVRMVGEVARGRHADRGRVRTARRLALLAKYGTTTRRGSSSAAPKPQQVEIAAPAPRARKVAGHWIIPRCSRAR